jgi:riboflavin biosynthesis pyrimidine reductase
MYSRISTLTGRPRYSREGGPHLIGHLLGEGLLDELFLTTSPVLAGRADTPRPGLIAGLELLPNRPERTDLISIRRRESYLFLRYRLQAPGGTALARTAPRWTRST